MLMRHEGFNQSLPCEDRGKGRQEVAPHDHTGTAGEDAGWSEKDKARFFAKVNKTDNADECWLWMAGTCGSGAFRYGTIRIARVMVKAHRVAWILANKKQIPKGMCVLHSCDNPLCCNHAHLRCGTHQDNMRDMKERGRCGLLLHPELASRGDDHYSRTRPELVARGDRHSSRLHPDRVLKGESHPMAKIDENEVRAIRQLAEEGARQSSLGLKFGISQSAVSLIILRKNWAHIS